MKGEKYSERTIPPDYDYKKLLQSKKGQKSIRNDLNFESDNDLNQIRQKKNNSNLVVSSNNITENLRYNGVDYQYEDEQYDSANNPFQIGFLKRTNS